MSDHRIEFVLNGHGRKAKVPSRLLLSDFLRHHVGLTGTRVGCEQGVCGACTVQVDGVPTRACLTLAVQIDGHEVRTVEALSDSQTGEMHALQESFHRHHALQCGFCTAGFLMSVESVLPELSDASREEVRGAISGNICRCTGYQPIVDAICDAVSGEST